MDCTDSCKLYLSLDVFFLIISAPSYHSKKDHKHTDYTCFIYNCTQQQNWQHKSKKNQCKGAIPCNKLSMHSHPCEGWLGIPIHSDSTTVLVSLKNMDNYEPYFNIEIPQHIKEFVQNHASLSSTGQHQKSIQLALKKVSSEELMRSGFPTSLSTQQLHFVWWKCCKSLVYARELSLDSAWNTNGSGYKVYAVLGEVAGSGCPLAYLLICAEDSSPGGKEQFIIALLNHLKEVWDIKASITLTDKDLSETNAFLDVYPEEKYQLCFWHALDAVQKQLSILRQKPKHYNEVKAHQEFSFIDKKFVPIYQSQELNLVHPSYFFGIQALKNRWVQ
ncbi:hypothetical protein GYMLUDRAFT_59633 [Collybiopsis luxurians FD-317 M1]|uniref:MULE transposase domain-containing protein n=1 Tax=Collybiopsis luxurians FD-317 M1 TaxID=944289 RepID=A0A0D0CN54_9AGAR|nr:hypothetical protein GYMLUDRAFT_59633 [Collybiopsis luxurians FD-317 M1]